MLCPYQQEPLGPLPWPRLAEPQPQRAGSEVVRTLGLQQGKSPI